MLNILALIVFYVSGIRGFAPFDFRAEIRASGYTGALCLTVDGPEFHRSCFVRSKQDPAVKSISYILGTPGVYAVILEDARGNRKVGQVEVLE
jgi:hypothetical protein